MVEPIIEIPAAHVEKGTVQLPRIEHREKSEQPGIEPIIEIPATQEVKGTRQVPRWVHLPLNYRQMV